MSGCEESTDWQLVAHDENDQESVEDTHSEGSIEVVCIGTGDLEEAATCQASIPAAKPYYVLRLPSSEQDLTTESESSDDSDAASNRSTSEFRVIRQRKTTLTKTDLPDVSSLKGGNYDVSSSVSPVSSREATPEHFMDNNDMVAITSCDLAESTEDSEESVPEFEIIHPEEIHPSFVAPNIVADIDNQGDGLAPGMGDSSDEMEEEIESGQPDVHQDVVQPDVHLDVVQPDVHLDVVQLDMHQDVVQLDMHQDVVQLDMHQDVVQPDVHQDVVQPDVEQDLVQPDREEEDVAQEEEMEDEQFVLMGGPYDGGDTESSAEMEVEDDRIESDQSTDHSQHSDDNSNMSNIDIGDLMADPTLIRQYVHQPNPHLNVTLNTVLVLVIAVAIGLGIGHNIGSKRERFLQRRMWQDNFNSLKSSPVDNNLLEKVKNLTKREKDLLRQLQNAETSLREKEDMVTAMKLDIEKYENMSYDQREEVKLMETMVQARYAELVTLKDQVEKLRIESLQQQQEKATISTRSIEEVTELRYKLMQAKDANIDLLAELNEQKTHLKNMEQLMSSLNATHEKKLREKEKSLKNIINMLEMEKQDLEQEVGSLRYSLHPGNDGTHTSHMFYKDRVNQLETEKLDLIKQVGSMRYSGYHVSDSSETLADNNVYKEVNENQSEIERLNRTVSELNSKLVTEQGKSEMWQRLYIASQKENKRTRTDNSSKDFFGCVTHLLKNVTVPQNLSRMFKEKVDLSLDALKYIYNVFKGEHSEHNKEHARESYVNKDKYKKAQTRRRHEDEEKKEERKDQHTWRETVEDVLNKTKSSMSDVSRQIQDTWKQVKNLSKDLWEKHEPTLEKFHRKLSQEVGAMTTNLQKKIKQTTEKLFRKWNKRRYKNTREDEDDTIVPDYRDSELHRQGHRTATSRQDHEHQRTFKNTPKFHSGENGRNGKWHMKRLDKLKKRIAKLGRKKYCKMDSDDVLSIFNALDSINTDFITPSIQQWYACQHDWWINTINAHRKVNPFIKTTSSKCMKLLHGWQRDIAKKNDWLCKQRMGDFKREHGHYKCGKKCRKQQTHHNHDDQSKYKKKSYSGHRHQKKGNRKHDHKKSDRHHPTRNHLHLNPNSIDTSRSILDNENSLKENCTINPQLRCDPFDSDCSDESLSWYMKHMSYRDAQRLAEEMETEKSEWLFSRSKARKELRLKEEDGERKAAWQFQLAKAREGSRNEDKIVENIDSESSCFVGREIFVGDCL